MNPETLESIGLSRNESKVYLALLNSGTLKTSQILKSTGLNSGRIYETFESLKKKGLISESDINGVKHYTAARPIQILKYAEMKKRQIESEEEKIKKILPEIESIRKESFTEPRSTVYTGLRGLKTAIDEATSTLEKNAEVLSMGITGLKDEAINRIWRNLIADLPKGITARYLFSEKSDHYERTKTLQPGKVRLLTGMTPVTVDIFGKKTVLILQYKAPMNCIIIHDENTATSFKNFFEQLWSIAKK